MDRLTPEAREELRERIALERRIQARKERELLQRTEASAGRARGQPPAPHRVVRSPSGVVHIALDDAGFRPICVHYAEGEAVGWTTYDHAWEDVPHDVHRCKSCIQLS